MFVKAILLTFLSCAFANKGNDKLVPSLRHLGSAGCTDTVACNYDFTATYDDDSCTYADAHRDCFGFCLNDADYNGICDEEENFYYGSYMEASANERRSLFDFYGSYGSYSSYLPYDTTESPTEAPTEAPTTEPAPEPEPTPEPIPEAQQVEIAGELDFTISSVDECDIQFLREFIKSSEEAVFQSTSESVGGLGDGARVDTISGNCEGDDGESLDWSEGRRLDSGVTIAHTYTVTVDESAVDVDTLSEAIEDIGSDETDTAAEFVASLIETLEEDYNITVAEEDFTVSSTVTAVTYSKSSSSGGGGGLEGYAIALIVIAVILVVALAAVGAFMMKGNGGGSDSADLVRPQIGQEQETFDKTNAPHEL